MKIFLDTETTGLEAGKDRICSLAMIVTDDNGRILDVFEECVFNPQVPLHPEAAKVNGFTDYELKNYPTIDVFMPEIMAFMTKHRAADAPYPSIVAHNVKFDMGFLKAEYAACYPSETNNFFDQFSVEDTRIMSINLFGDEHGFRSNLNWLAQRLGIDASARSAIHSAMVDTEIMMKSYFSMKNSKEVN